MKRKKSKKRPAVRLNPIYGWPLTGPDAPEDDDAVSDHLKQELLDWSDFWHEHADAEGVFDSEVVEAEYVQRGRGLQSRLQRELDRPVAFREY